MCFTVNGQMQLPPDTAAFFAVFSDFPFAFTGDLQLGGINHQMRDFPPGWLFETDSDRLCPPADIGVIRTAQRNAHQGENGINEALSSPQGQPEYSFNPLFKLIPRFAKLLSSTLASRCAGISWQISYYFYFPSLRSCNICRLLQKSSSVPNTAARTRASSAVRRRRPQIISSIYCLQIPIASASSS